MSGRKHEQNTIYGSKRSSKVQPISLLVRRFLEGARPRKPNTAGALGIFAVDITLVFTASKDTAVASRLGTPAFRQNAAALLVATQALLSARALSLKHGCAHLIQRPGCLL